MAAHTSYQIAVVAALQLTVPSPHPAPPKKIHHQEYSRRSHPEHLKYSKNCLVAGPLPQTPLGSLQHSPDPLANGEGLAAPPQEPQIQG